MTSPSDLITIHQDIEKLEKRLYELLAELEGAEKAKAQAKLEYEKDLAVTILKLRNSTEKMWENQLIESVPVTLIEKTAKGIVAPKSMALDVAESALKSLYVKIASVRDMLSVKQSLLRYIE